ncbi:MAG: hypothetical protein ACFFDN_16870, partial [Candidatus Hodarchaeota archaeon]
PVSEKDDLYYSKQKFQSLTIKIDNHDQTWKNFNIGSNVSKRNGNYARILFWSGEDADSAAYDDFDLVYQGVIEKTTEGRIIEIILKDLRYSLKTTSPARYLDTTDYSYIKDPDKEYILPQVWGKCYDVPCICLNEDVNDGGGSTAYLFLVCDINDHDIASNSIQTVYINNKKVSLSPTISTDSTQGFAYFSIDSDYFGIDNGGNIRFENMDKVTIDVHGYLKGSDFKESDGSTTGSPTDLIENGLAILREIIKYNYDWDYISVFYDITTWQTYEDAAYDIGYFLNSPIATYKQIEELAITQLGEFIWNENLKFSFNNDDFSSFALEIDKYKFFPEDYFPTFSVDSTEVLAKFRVGYQKKWNQKDELAFSWSIDNSNESTALMDYNSTKEKDFETLINNSTDALAYAIRILTFGGISIDTFTIRTTWDAKDLKKGDWIKVQGDYISEDLVGWCKCQIQSVSLQTDTWTVEMELRIFEYYPLLVDSEGLFILAPTTKKFILGVS